MLDNILNTVKKGAEKVQRRGEEVAQIARLKMEIFQLTRELDGHYARLGRAYHDGKPVDILSGIREDIRHTEDEVKGRERLITELGDTPDPRPDSTSIEKVETAPSTSASPSFPGTGEIAGSTSSSSAHPNSTPSGTPPASTTQSTASQPSTGNQPPFTNSTDETPR
ncbi:hypothetical protein [Deinococcus fonticola]|uniref:hypothetical protein n=1 Tax=Deinococcus fonticola TaxID=2528713 RepID=UPI0010750BE6|nr:hypothetical protein [Deinococcus fonticola]